MDRETKLDIIELARGYLGVLILATLMYTGVVTGMYAGNTMTIETNLTNPVYTVVGNSSNLEGLNITFEDGIISVSPAVNYKPDNFTLIFFDNLTKEVIQTIHTGGGGTRVRYVDNNVTVYVPEYINETIEVEVEKIVDTIKYVEDEFALTNWDILLAIVVGGIMVWFWMRNKKV